MALFNKRTYRPRQFARDAFALGRSVPFLVKSIAAGKISPAFREKIMLAVTGVNDCRYCIFVHSKLAGHYDVDPEQIRNILENSLDEKITSEELVAIEFTVHYAQSRKKPNPEMLEKLTDHYGEEKAREMVLYMDTIYLANLSGNTFDSFLSRLKGENSGQDNFLFELIFAIFAAPILLPQATYLSLRNRAKA